MPATASTYVTLAIADLLVDIVTTEDFIHYKKVSSRESPRRAINPYLFEERLGCFDECRSPSDSVSKIVVS